MKKLILFLIPFFLYATNSLYLSSNLQWLFNLNYIGSSPHCNSLSDIQFGGGYYLETNYKGFTNENSSCLKNNAKPISVKICGYGSNGGYGGDFTIYQLSSSALTFCHKHDGYVYASSANVWFPISSDSNASPICPDGLVYNSSQEKCIPTYKTQENQCYSKCGGSNLVKYFGLNSNGSTTCVCYTCDDLLQKVTKYCSSFHFKVTNFKCSESSGKIISTNYTDNNLNYCDVKCSPGYHLKAGTKICLLDSDSSSSSLKSSDNNVSDSNSTIALNNNQNNQNNKDNQNSDNQNQNNKDNQNSDNQNQNNKDSKKYSSLSVNCCSLYNNPKIGDSWSQISPGVWKQSNSPYCQITLKNGQCSIKSSKSSDDLSSLSSKVSQANSKLFDINKNIKDMINLKPDKNPSGELDSDTKSFLSGFSDTIKNIKNSVSNLKDSAGKIESLLNNPSKVTLFSNSNIQTCPVNFSLYKSKQTFDICKMVSPYRPLIQLFFSIFFSLSVLLYFFDIFIRSK